MDGSALTPEGGGYAVVLATVDESADLWATNGKKGDSYKTTYQARGRGQGGKEGQAASSCDREGVAGWRGHQHAPPPPGAQLPVPGPAEHAPARPSAGCHRLASRAARQGQGLSALPAAPPAPRSSTPWSAAREHGRCRAPWCWASD